MLECSILLAYRKATAAVNIANTIKTNAKKQYPRSVWASVLSSSKLLLS